MNSGRAEKLIETPDAVASRSNASAPVLAVDELLKVPRIALLTPYTGGNLGDAAIQDAVIANIRRLLPRVQFSGITLNSENFLEQHGTDVFPLVGEGIPFFRMDTKWTPGTDDLKRGNTSFWRLRRALKSLPVVSAANQFSKKIRNQMRVIRSELSHCIGGYRFLRSHDLLLFSGGGQLDDNYGGTWGLPFALFKWAVLARFARIPCAMASIGVGTIRSPVSHNLISVALRLCSYRSFRETRSRAAASTMFRRASNDPVVPDFALSLSDAELPSIAVGVRAMAGGRPIVAFSPMAFAKPANWPVPDRALHDRYVQQMAEALSELFRQGYFIVVACSSRGDDESVIPDILERLDSGIRENLREQIYFPKIGTWKDLVSVLHNADYMIASRLHGTIFGFLTETPVVAISFALKADWIIEYLRQSDYRLDIRDFSAHEVLETLNCIKLNRNAVVNQIASHRKEVLADAASARQYSLLARLALEHRRSRN